MRVSQKARDSGPKVVSSNLTPATNSLVPIQRLRGTPLLSRFLSGANWVQNSPYCLAKLRRDPPHNGQRLRALPIRLDCCIPAYRVAVAMREESICPRQKIRSSRGGSSEFSLRRRIPSTRGQHQK